MGATMYGAAISGNGVPATGYGGCNGDDVIFVSYDVSYYKMVSVKLADAKASATPSGQTKYIKAGANTIQLDRETVCKMWNGDGYANTNTNPPSAYQLKGVKASNCKEKETTSDNDTDTDTDTAGCSQATMYGAAISGNGVPATGYGGCNGDDVIFVSYDV